MHSLKEIVNNNDTLAGRIFDWSIQFFIVLSLITFSIETLPNLSQKSKHFLWIIELTCIAIFSIEYLLRVSLSENKLKFIFSFYGIIDLMAVLPFYITGIYLRSLRAFRLLRLFRTLKLIRYNKAVQRLKTALVMAKEELILFMSITCILLYLAAVGIYYFENTVQPNAFSSIFDGLWWAVATLTTVGYGDIYPVTTGGKIFTFIILMIGLGIVAVPAAIFSSALSKTRDLEN